MFPIAAGARSIQNMDVKTYNKFCKSLMHSTSVVQWGGSHVWKIGGKVYAVGSVQDEGNVFVSFKASPIAFEVLGDQPGLRPAPYLASRGMKWIQWMSDETLSEDELKAHIEMSYQIVGAGLTKKLQRELGLLDD